MNMLNELESVELLTEYQKNEVVIGTLFFFILFVTYKTVTKSMNLFEVLYMPFAFGLCYLTVLIFYNYISYFQFPNTGHTSINETTDVAESILKTSVTPDLGYFS